MYAEKVGVEYGLILGLQKQDMIAELDAVLTHLHGLSGRQLVHIFKTFRVRNTALMNKRLTRKNREQ